MQCSTTRRLCQPICSCLTPCLWVRNSLPFVPARFAKLLDLKIRLRPVAQLRLASFSTSGVYSTAKASKLCCSCPKRVGTVCVSSKFKTKQLRTRMIRNMLFTRQVRVSRFCVSFSFLPPLPRPSPPLCFLSQQAGYSKLAISLRLTRLSRACRLSEPCPTLNIITSLQSLWALPRPEMQDKISARM